MEQYFKTNTQLMARCTFNASTGKVQYENFRKYYTDIHSNPLNWQLYHYGKTEKIYHTL